MTGEDLYNLWFEAMADQGIDAGGWEELEDAEHDAWNSVAVQVRMA